VPNDIGLDDWLPTLARLFTALPDLSIRPVTLLTDDDTAIVEMHQTGTNTGVLTLDDFARALLATDLDHIPPTGRTVDVTGVVVLVTSNGAVTGERHHWPRHWLYEHLGLATQPAIPTVRA
jgi:predicted ester cyclase